MRLFFLLLFCGLPALAQPDFRPMVREALRRGENPVVIAPGVYRLAPAAGQGVIWTLQKVRDVEIIADGVTLLATQLTRAVQLEKCRNVTLRGLTIDYDPLPFTQGTVVAVADDKSWIDIKLHDGYPRQPYARIDVIDSQTRFRKKGMPFLWGTKAEMSAPDTVRVALKDIGKTAQIGDLASLSTGPQTGGVPHAFTIERCENVTLRGVTLHAAPGMGFLEAEGEGRAKFLACRIVRGPKPAGATQERLLTTSWDAMQSKSIHIGPRVENCIIEDAGDDSWSVQSSDYMVVRRAGREVTLAARDEYTDGPRVGDTLRTSLSAPSATIVALGSSSIYPAPSPTPEIIEKIKNAAPWSLWRVSPKFLTFTLDRDAPFNVGDSVFCPQRQGNGFVFRNNKIHSSGRVLIKAGGLVENNVLDWPHALSVCPEVPGEAAAGIKDLTIRGNIIRNAGYFCPAPWSAAAGVISITAGADRPKFRVAGIFENILIENNIVANGNGPNLVVTSASGVTIRNNRFIGAHREKPNETGASYDVARDAIIWATQSEGVKFQNNKMEYSGAFLGKEYVFTDSVR
jgi:hypothetical protein